MSTDPNKYLNELNSLLDEFDVEFDKAFTNVYGYVKHCKRQPETIETALVDYYNFRFIDNKLLYTSRLLQFPDTELKREIWNNFAFQVRNEGQVFYKQLIIEMANRIRKLNGYTVLYLTEYTEIKRIYENNNYNPDPKAFAVHIVHDIKNIDKALSGLYEVLREANITWINGDQKIVKSNSRQKSVVSNEKLIWNASKDSLYDLFAQMSLVNSNPDTPLLGNTIKGLAQFLSANVEDMPSVGTIERRILEFRNPDNQPKRNRITLDLIKAKQ